MVLLKGIRVSKGSRVLLDLPQLRFAAGKVTVILGPNGAGKSTLLKVISGALTPDQGEALIFGRPLREWSPLRLAQSRAMLSQNYSLPFPMLVRDLLAMGRFPHRASPLDDKMIDEALDDMNLKALQDRNVQTLSGGEQQRAHMARVLLQLRDDQTPDSPKLLLLDEPVSSLDIVHQQSLLNRARQAARQGYTVVIVLHDLNLALQYADSFILLKEGRLQAEDTRLCPEILSQVFDTPMHQVTDARTEQQYIFANAR